MKTEAPQSSNPVDLAEIKRLRGLLARVDELIMRERQSNKGYVREIRKTIRQALHQHTARCWEPDSSCDMGRNEEFVQRVTDETTAAQPAVTITSQVCGPAGFTIQANTPICPKCGQIDVRIPRMGIYHVCPSENGDGCR